MKKLLFGLAAWLIAVVVGSYNWGLGDWQFFLLLFPAAILFWYFLDQYARIYYEERVVGTSTITLENLDDENIDAMCNQLNHELKRMKNRDEVS